LADRKPIRWFVPQGGESFMGVAAYYLTHEENMRQSFSQPSRSVRRTLPDGTTIDYVMNDVVDCIMISPPQGIQRVVGKSKKMIWDKLPPFETGTTSVIDLSQMTEDPDVEGGYYCTVSVFNGTDENGRTLSATFSIEASHTGWSIYQGVRQDDGTYKADGKNATLRLYEPTLDGTCIIIANDGRTTLKKTVSAFKDHFYYLGDNGLYYTVSTTTGRTTGESAEAEDVSVNPFEFYGEQNEVRHDIAYYTVWHHYIKTTKSIFSVTWTGEDSYTDLVIKIEKHYIDTMLSTNDPNPLAGADYIVEETYQPTLYWSREAQAALPTSEIEEYDETSWNPVITTEGGGVLPSFLILQSPMSDGASVYTRAMKKPGEEIYFVVIENSATPDYKTIVWFINSTSYTSYEFSFNLEWEGVSLLLDNVYYGSSI
jgi:hypothetical protein